MYDDEPISKIIKVFGMIGIAIIVFGVYVARAYNPLAGAGIIVAGSSLLILPMTRKRY